MTLPLLEASEDAPSPQVLLVQTYLERTRRRPPLLGGSGSARRLSSVAHPLPSSREHVPLPAAVRSAMAFIAARAADPIGLTEIADAARLSPRALQVAFRRHLGTTPLAHLRAVRMARVHADLQSARPGDGQTVSAVANRWGISQLSRFAHDYKQRYGVSPRDTLDRSSA